MFKGLKRNLIVRGAVDVAKSMDFNKLLLIIFISVVIFWLFGQEGDAAVPPTAPTGLILETTSKKSAPIPASILNAELQKRMPLWKEWLSAAQEITDNDQEAMEALNFLEKNYYLVAPCKDSLVKIISPPPLFQGGVGILILTEGDFLKYPEWEEEFYGGLIAVFSDIAEPIVAIDNRHNLSRLSKGLVLIHNALSAMVNKSANPLNKEEERAVEELISYELQNRILLRLFGNEYEKLIQQEAGRIARFEIIHKREIPSRDFLTSADTVIKKIIGPPVSETEKIYWRSILWYGSVFRMLEQTHPKDAEGTKLRFLLNMYEQEE